MKSPSPGPLVDSSCSSLSLFAIMPSPSSALLRSHRQTTHHGVLPTWSAQTYQILGVSDGNSAALFFAHHQDTLSSIFINCSVLHVASAPTRARTYSSEPPVTPLLELTLTLGLRSQPSLRRSDGVDVGLRLYPPPSMFIALSLFEERIRYIPTPWPLFICAFPCAML